MKVSIVIPALNEAKNLPALLESIRSQNFDDYEIILADARSSDDTRKIALEAGCRVVDGGLPAVGRNAGAAAALGEFLFFLDADVILPRGFIRNVYEEMQDRYFDLATCEIRPLSQYRLDRVIHRMINLAVQMNLRIDPKAFGFCIFVTKRLFDRVGGFDATIYVAEDNDFVKRASVFRPLHYLGSAHIMASVRRFQKEGRFAYMRKGVKLNLYRTFRGEIRSDEVVKYEFDRFDRPDAREEKAFLDWLEKRLLRLEERSLAPNGPASGGTEGRQMQPRLDEFAFLVEDLDAYLGKKERRARRMLKWKNFFKRRN
ncbi:MAG: glycosyltransferase [Treponema sp.]|nr:glycosyltransferase [Treponema sp.]